MTSIAELPVGSSGTADGRRARRQRNRDAVVHALLALYDEGRLDPSSDEIAARAGLSPRSLFRYFDDVDDLCRAAVSLQYERVWPVLRIELPEGAGLAERVAALAAQRARLFDAVGSIGRVSRLRAPFQPLIAEELARARSYLRHQVARTIAPELAAMDHARAEAALAALDVLCSYEAHELWLGQGLTAEQTVAVLADAITRLLAPEAP
jgi:AcrR family transcriptional regulator